MPSFSWVKKLEDNKSPIRSWISIKGRPSKETLPKSISSSERMVTWFRSHMSKNNFLMATIQKFLMTWFCHSAVMILTWSKTRCIIKLEVQLANPWDWQEPNSSHRLIISIFCSSINLIKGKKNCRIWNGHIIQILWLLMQMTKLSSL